LERGNNQKQCRYHLEQAKKSFYGVEFDWENVLKHLNRAIKLDPENVEALTEKSNVYGYIGAYVYIDNQEEYSKKSFKLLEKALSIDPTYKRARLYQAIEYFYLQQKEKAKEIVDQVQQDQELSWKEENFVDIYT
jgi:tetratricopeptide (TPR) repeat protein